MLKYILIYLGIMTVITFFLYALDKKKAQTKGARRIPEATLLAFSILGGALGGYLAMIIRHHKTKHWYFVLTNILGIVAYALLIYFMI